jgi:hypothetical protein
MYIFQARVKEWTRLYKCVNLNFDYSKFVILMKRTRQSDSEVY